MPHSPLKASPLARGPGDSLLRQFFDETIYPPFLWLMGLMYAMGMFFGTAFPDPKIAFGLGLFQVLSGAAFAVCVGVIAWRWRSWMSRMDKLHKGRAGEQAAAAVLAELGKDGYIIVHDVPLKALDPSLPDGPNIDHLLIGPAGVFVIETKYVAKSRGDSKPNEVTFDASADGGRGRLLFNGRSHDRCALEQTRRNAKTVDVFLRSKQPGHPVPVRPIILVIGWMVKVPNSLDVAVLNPKLIFPLLRGFPSVLDKRQVGTLYEAIVPAICRRDTTSDLFDSAA